MGVQRKTAAIAPARQISPAGAERTIPAPDYGYGNRFNSDQPKGLGFLGGLQRPDGGVMSEYSIGVNLDGQETEIPTLVPTLSHDEVLHLLSMREGDAMPPAIVQKAVAFAKQRRAAGQEVFAGPGNQQPLYPDIPRAPAPAIRRRTQ